MMRMIAIVSSIGVLLRAASPLAAVWRAVPGGPGGRLSNGYATVRARARRSLLSLVLLMVSAVPAAASGKESQDANLKQTTSNEQRAASFPIFLAGAAIGLGAHETGHLVFDGIFDAHPGIERVSFHGIPFFAITHDPNLSARKEFVI